RRRVGSLHGGLPPRRLRRHARQGRRRRGRDLMRHWGVIASLVALAAMAGVALTPEGHAELVDPTVATSVAVGTGGNDRGGRRDGHVAALPVAPVRRWSQSLPGRIDFAPAIDGKGNVLVVTTSSTEGSLVELSAKGGTTRETKLRMP